MRDPYTTQLYCPTCGEQFMDLEFHVEEAVDTSINLTEIRDVILPRGPGYLLCPNKHKWTVKYITRAANRPDRVLLGNYLGIEP